MSTPYFCGLLGSAMGLTMRSITGTKVAYLPGILRCTVCSPQLWGATMWWHVCAAFMLVVGMLIASQIEYNRVAELLENREICVRL